MKKSTGPALFIGNSEHCPDIRHATGLVAPDPLVLLTEGERMTLAVSKLEFGRFRRALPAAQVFTPESLGLKDDALRAPGEWALALLRRRKCGTIRVAPAFPLAAARILEAGDIVLEVVADGRLRPARAVKTPTEIGYLRQAQRAAAAAVRQAGALIAASTADRHGILRLAERTLTSERVRAVIRETVLRHGCLDTATIVAGGAHGADPHECGSGPLRAGEFIVVDVFPRHLESGYWGDITRTFLRGTPSETQRRMYAAVRRAQRAALRAVRPGASGADVHQAAERSLAESGFKTELRNGLPVGFIHGTGHGVGLEIHEAPTLSKVGGELRPGMVVTVEPGLYYPELGGVRIEDTVLVTEDGCRRLASLPVLALET